MKRHLGSLEMKFIIVRFPSVAFAEEHLPLAAAAEGRCTTIHLRQSPSTVTATITRRGDNNKNMKTPDHSKEIEFQGERREEGTVVVI